MYEEIETSKYNLLKSPLFNFVDIHPVYGDPHNIIINVKVEERWYLWPEAAIYYVDRNFSNWLKEKDWSHIDIGLGIVKYNFRGRNEKLSLYTFFGYDEEILVYYENMYLDKKRNHSLSFFFENLRRKETSYIVQEDVLRQIMSDDEYIMRSQEFRIKYTYRKKLYNSHSFYLAYENRKASDSLLRGNPEYLNNPDQAAEFFSLKYIFLRDKRNSRVFPTNGHKLEFSAKKIGLGVFPESEINSLNFNFDISFYNEINDRFFYNTNLTLKKTFGSQNPFFLNQGLGYTSNIRAYEYNVVNGRDLFLMKHSFYGKLMSKKIVHLKFIPWKKFNKIHFTLYGGIHSDFAYVVNHSELYNQSNEMANQFLIGFGAGLNLITYYDKMIRLEYSFNKDLKAGLYLHFEAPF